MKTEFCGRTFLNAFLVLLVAFPAAATTLTVRKDGTGQYTTINAARAVAVAGDVIEVGPGVYAEEVDIDIPLTLVSTEGSGATVLDGEGVRRILVFRAGSGSVVDGFTLRRGFHVSSGGALRVQLGATVTARNCVFEDNVCDFDGAAIICRDPSSRIDVIDCRFRDNAAARHAGAAVLIEYSASSFERCTFEDNTGSSSGALASASGASYSVTNCVFLGNAGSASAIYALDSSIEVLGNTFYGNPGGSATVGLHFSNAVVERNIFAKNDLGWGLLLFDMDASAHSCNVYWENADGAVAGGSLGQDEVLADPVFCDVAAGDYTISIHSPAAPANSPCGELIGAFPTNCNILPPPPPPPPPPIAPVIIGITDVADDQGRQVRIRWDRIRYDAPGEDYTITGYAIYRKQNDAAPATALPAAPRGERAPMLDGWDYIATVPARGDDIYQYVAPTLCDTPKNGDPCWSYFFVSAMTPYPLTYFDSAPDSGYSEDNLPPAPPNSFAVEFTGNGAYLTWNAPADPDIASYRVYRTAGDTEDRTLIHTTDDTEWMDSDPAEGTHYLLAAVDDAGNEGAAVAPTTTTGAGPRIPAEYFLGQNAPNPFNPSTTIEFGVPAGGGRATIEIFDVAGRRVRTLLDEPRGAGTWRVTWDGTTDGGARVSSGVYFYRLRSPGFEDTRRMTLVE